MEDNKEMGRDMEIIFIFLPISLERDTFLLLDFWKKEWLVLFFILMELGRVISSFCFWGERNGFLVFWREGPTFVFFVCLFWMRECVCVGKCYRDSQVFVIFWSVFSFALCTRFSLFIKEWVVLFILIKKILFTLEC